MTFSELFIRRPVMTLLLMTGIIVFGIASYKRLAISDLPTVDYPTISVNASLPGASPATMAAAIATPLEKQFSSIAGIDNMTSTSSLGSTSITLQFSLDRDIDAAAQDVQAAIAKTLRQLPQGITPPSYSKANPAASPILFFALTSPTLSLTSLDEVGETTIAQRLSMIDGVAAVQVFGSAKYAVRVQLDPTAMAYRKIGIDEVAQAISAQNVSQPTGVLWGKTTAYTLQASGQLEDANAFRALTVSYRNGAAVQLGALGRVVDDVENNRNASWFNGQRSIVLAVQRQPGTNTVAVAQAVNAELDSMRPNLPGGVRIQTLFDRSVGIQNSVSDVKHTLLLTLVLVIAVIFLFLRNVWATLIPSLALPLSVVGTFPVMYLLGYSLDTLSLMALTLAVGFVVDDAIVMLENIVRHLEMGKAPIQAAIDGAAEVGFTILSMTISLVAVFIPLLFLGGVIGRLFREFAVVIATSILVSGVVSLTFTPMLSSRLLRAEGNKAHGRFYNVTERAWDWTLDKYKTTLDWTMAHRALSMIFSLLVLVGTVVLFKIIPSGFIPDQDTGQINISTQAAQGTSFEDMVRRQQQIAAIVQRDTNVNSLMSSVGGGGGSSASNTGRLSVTLKPLGKRLAAQDVVNELRGKLARIPGIQAFPSLPPAIQIGGRSARAAYQFTMQSSDVDALYTGAMKLQSAAQQSNLLQDVNSDMQNSNPQINVQIDRTRAAAFGVTADQIESSLYDAYGSRQAGLIYTPANEYSVILELEPQYQQDLSALNLLFIRAQSGTLVPLRAVASLTRTVGPVSINHSGQMPSVTISFNLAPGVSLGAATSELEQLAARDLPNGITTAFSGTAQVFQQTQAGLLVLIVLAVFVIYMVLGVLYESFIHPITILSGLPFAAFGALLALWICHVELSVFAFVGIILLIGIVKKNAIMMVDFAVETERTEHKPPGESIVHAAHIRFRPIMMTTVAALVGTLPVALATGMGSESRRPLGIAVVGGLAFSQLVTLYITPVVYTYLDPLNRRLERKLARDKKKQAGAAGPAVVDAVG
ncbi:MAG TPA: efflux RND transporter permease subunit [Gemmatimonadaceae bacterium]|nr:efflux RND transporter permease subunit [Gemmatimonadaceae bacterium]